GWRGAGTVLNQEGVSQALTSWRRRYHYRESIADTSRCDKTRKRVKGMAVLNFWHKTSLVVLCLAALDTQPCSAQLFPKDPAKWWPDPSTGLMWAEHGYSGQTHGWLQTHGRTWQESVDYCAALKLGGFSG